MAQDPKNPQVPESTDREHPDMPETVEEPQRDPNLEDQTLDQASPGPGASKMENLRRIQDQVRVQKERADDATRPEESEEAVRPEVRGTTAEEQREGETLDERLAREQGEGPGFREDAGTLVENGDGSVDDEKDFVADDAPAPEGRSAEEAALRVEPEAPGAVDGPDSYLEEEEER